MKTLNIIVCTVLVSGLLGMSQVALAEKRLLTADEVTALVSGKTAWLQHAFKDKKLVVYYSPDGTWKSKRLDKNKTDKGKWSVDKEGRLCMNKWKNCRRIYDVGGAVKDHQGSNEHNMTYTKFEDGDKLCDKC